MNWKGIKSLCILTAIFTLIWIVLNIQAINYLEPDSIIICNRNNLTWEIKEYYDIAVPKEVSDFYITHISSREANFDKPPHPIFIGNNDIEVYSGSNSVKLKKDDLLGYSDFMLCLIAAEIKARHGAVFKEPFLKAYFSSRSWYKPDNNFNMSKLSSIEKANLETIELGRKDLKLTSLDEIAKLFFKEFKYKSISLGDLNKDKKEELLLAVPSSKPQVFSKAMIVRKEEDNKYTVLLKIYTGQITGRDEEVVSSVPGETKVFKITFGEDKVLVTFMDQKYKSICDRIELTWSEKLGKYYLLIYP